MFPIIQKHALKLCEKLERLVGQEVELNQMIATTALGVIGELIGISLILNFAIN